MNTTEKSRPSNDGRCPPSSHWHLLIDAEGQLVPSDDTALVFDPDDLVRINAAEEYLRRWSRPVDDDQIVELVLAGKRAASPTRTARRVFDANREANVKSIKRLLTAQFLAAAARVQASLDGCAMSSGYLIEFTLEDARSTIPTLGVRLRFDSNRAAHATMMRIAAGSGGVPVAAMANGSDLALPLENIPWPPCSLPDIDHEALVALARAQASHEGAEPRDEYVLQFTLELLRGSIARLPDRLNFDRHRAAARVKEVLP